MDAFQPDTFDGHKHIQHHVEDYFEGEQPSPSPPEPDPAPPPEQEAWKEAVAPEISTESRASSKSKLHPEVERLVDQLYESTWNLKALKYLGSTSEEACILLLSCVFCVRVPGVQEGRAHCVLSAL